MQAPTPEFTDVGASLFAGVMLQLLQYVKSHTLSSLLVHITKLSFRWQQERHAKGYALFVRNHPKSTVLFKFFALSYFAGKKSHV